MGAAARADEHAPPPVKSIWIAVFLMAIPVGYALGYVYGGVLGPLLGWRLAFLSEASLMLPFVAFAFLTTPIPFSHGPPPVADRSVPGSETAQLLQEEEALVDTAAARSSSNGGEPRSSVQGAARFDRRKLWAAVAPLARDVGSVLGCVACVPLASLYCCSFLILVCRPSTVKPVHGCACTHPNRRKRTRLL